MGLFKGKRYRKCQLDESGTNIDCVAYSPDKTGKKIVTATIRATLTSDCQVAINDSDGDTNDIADLEEHLSKRVRTKCNKPSNI
jgi:hypothetical protein